MSSLKSNLPITSREYKLLLKTLNFNNRHEGLEIFWTILEPIVNEVGGKCIKYKEDIKRITWFLDTPEDSLLKLGYILRIRDEEDGEKRYKITLKFRHSDRYIASAVDLSCAEKTNRKFEEDILLPFKSKFSQSVSFRKREIPRFITISDLLEFFPKIVLPGVHSRAPLVVRSDFRAYEITHRIGAVDFGGDMQIKCCLNFWYRSDERTGIPVVTEFSFDYDADDESGALEHYPESTVKKAYEFFNKLQTDTVWFDPESRTKTSLIGELKVI